MKKDIHFYIILTILFFVFLFIFNKNGIILQPVGPVLDEITPGIIYNAQPNQAIFYGSGFTQNFSLNAFVAGSNLILDEVNYPRQWISSQEIRITFPQGLPLLTAELSIIDSNNVQSNTLFFEIRSGLPPHESKVWFAPNIASDFYNLFTSENLWPNSRRNVDVFLLFSEALINTSVPCPYCGNTSYQGLIQIGAFDKLKEWNMSVAMSAPAVKHWACQASVTRDITVDYIENLKAAGINPTYLIMDEPYIGGELIVAGQGCGYTMQESAVQTAWYINQIRALYPSIKIGDIEPYPYYTGQQFKDWVLELENNGANLDFFHFDVDVNSVLPINVSEINDLKAFFESKNMTFGVVYWNYPTPLTSSNYVNNTFEWLKFVKNNSFQGTDHIFESWVANIPINLPENNSVTHTNLILRGLPIILDNDARFVNQNVPITMTSGQSYTAYITLLNNGTENWEGNEIYSLGSQNPIDNTNWETNRIRLVPNEIVKSGNYKTFSFMVTAPSVFNETNYSFQWRMVHENIEWFGTSTANISVKVIPSSGGTPGGPGGSPGGSPGGPGGNPGGPGSPPPSLAQCSDGIDNDGDGKKDFPADVGCSYSGDSFELDSVLEIDNKNKTDSDIQNYKKDEIQLTGFFWVIVVLLIGLIVFVTLIIIKFLRKRAMIENLSHVSITSS